MRAIAGFFLSMLIVTAYGCGDDDDDGTSGGGGAAGTSGSGGETAGSGGGQSGSGGSGGGGEAGSGGDAAGSGGGGGSTSGPAFEDLPPLLAQAMCSIVETCMGEDIVAGIYGEGMCEDRVVASVEDGDFGYTGDAIAAGRVTYNPDRVDACLASIQSAGCDFNATRFMRNDACGEVLVGAVEAGGECGVEQDCLGDTFCKLDSCPGICTPLLAAGSSCQDDDQCQEGLHCSDNTEKCATVAAEGAACGGGTGPDCEIGMVCAGEDEDTATQGVCTAQADVFTEKLGDSCSFETGTLCEPGLCCILVVETVDGGPQALFECAEGVSSGQDCSFGVPTQCPFGEYCSGIDLTAGDYAGTCQPLPGEGQDCVQDLAGSCAPGLVCDTDGKCHAVGRLGDPCVSDLGCASELCQGGVCARPPLCEI